MEQDCPLEANQQHVDLGLHYNQSPLNHKTFGAKDINYKNIKCSPPTDRKSTLLAVWSILSIIDQLLTPNKRQKVAWKYSTAPTTPNAWSIRAA